MRRYIATKTVPPWRGFYRTCLTQVYDAIKASGETGLDRREIATQTGLSVARVSSYLADLKRQSLIRLAGPEVIDPATLNAKDSALYALTILEGALVAKAREVGVTPDMERGFAVYQKIKALALGAATPGEEAAAMRQALIKMVQLVY